MRALVMSVFLHACETWTLTAELQLRRILTRTSHGNEMLSKDPAHPIHGPCNQTSRSATGSMIQHAIGCHEDLLTTVKRRKLKWQGYVSRSPGLAKTVWLLVLFWTRLEKYGYRMTDEGFVAECKAEVSQRGMEEKIVFKMILVPWQTVD